MNRSRLEPLGVPGGRLCARRGGGIAPRAEQRSTAGSSSRSPRKLGPVARADRAVGRARASRRATAPCACGFSTAKRSGNCSSIRICTSAISTARAASQVRGDLLTLLLEAYRYTSENTGDRPGAGARPEARARPVRLEAQHPPPLRHRQRLLQALARPRGAAIHLRVLRGSRHDDRASAASEDASRLPQAAAQGRRARRRGRRRLGRLRVVHGEELRRARAQLQHLEGADRALARVGEAARARRPSRVRRGRLPQSHGHLRRVRLDRHARARRQGQLQGSRRADEPRADARRPRPRAQHRPRQAGAR